LVKIKDEKRELEYKRKEMDLEAEKNKEIAKIKDQYQDKQIEQLNKQIEDNNDRYAQILKRLPDVNVRLNGKA